MFRLLTTLPITEISSSATPEDSSSLRSALFTLSTSDNRDVTWKCQLTNTGTWDGGKVSGLTTVPTAGSVGTSTGWQACSDPQVCIMPAVKPGACLPCLCACSPAIQLFIRSFMHSLSINLSNHPFIHPSIQLLIHSCMQQMSFPKSQIPAIMSAFRQACLPLVGYILLHLSPVKTCHALCQRLCLCSSMCTCEHAEGIHSIDHL